MIRASLAFAAALVVMGTIPAFAQVQSSITPAFAIWDAKFGAPVTDIPLMDVVDLACGTNGGPPSTSLRSFADFKTCQPEPSGLREVYFENDDEMDYLAKADDAEYKFLQGGTSIYAHPVVISVLVDDGGIIRGIRIVTDERVSIGERRVAVTLARNLKGRYGAWKLNCQDIPLQPGQNPVGTQFVHELCTGEDAKLGQRMRLEASYLRKKGQDAFNTDTQQINAGYFQSQTRLEVVELPYEPSIPAS